MSCCNFGRGRNHPIGSSARFGRGFDRFDGFDRFGRGFDRLDRSERGLDNRRGCCNVNWGSCRDTRFCPRRGPSRPRPRRPF